MNSPNPYFYNVTRTLTLHDHKKKLQNDWNCLGFINILKYWMIMKFTKPLFLLSDSNQKTIGSPRNHCFSLLKRTKNAPQLAHNSGRICWTPPGGKEFWPTFASATKNFAPLICRVVRAVLVLGAGLGFPVGAPAVFTPNLRNTNENIN